MRGHGIRGMAFAAAMMMAPGIGIMSAAADVPAVMPRAPKKQLKAAKRQQRQAIDVAPSYRRSRNPPPKRKLKANRLHVSKRVRRRHRRARRGK